MDKDEILKLKVDELRAKLTELNLQTTGRKTTLQDRLFEHFNIDPDSGDSDTEHVSEDNAGSVHSEDEGSNSEDNDEEKENKQASTMFTLRDIRESLNYFDGNGQPEIEEWIEEFEDNALSVGWDRLQKFIYAKQLIKGAAKIRNVTKSFIFIPTTAKK